MKDLQKAIEEIVDKHFGEFYIGNGETATFKQAKKAKEELIRLITSREQEVREEAIESVLREMMYGATDRSVKLSDLNTYTYIDLDAYEIWDILKKYLHQQKENK